MPIQLAEPDRLVATGLYHAMEIAERRAKIVDEPDMRIEGMPSEGRYEPAVDFVFRTKGHPSAFFGRRDVEAIHKWLGEWLDANPTPPDAYLPNTVWQNTPQDFIN